MGMLSIQKEKNMNDFDWEKLVEDSKSYEPCASLWIDKDAYRVELLLDTNASTYNEWLKGEGADISLVRCRETNKIVGVNLPLYKTNFSIFHTNGIQVKVNEGYKKLFLEQPEKKNKKNNTRRK